MANSVEGAILRSSDMRRFIAVALLSGSFGESSFQRSQFLSGSLPLSGLSFPLFSLLFLLDGFVAYLL